MSYLFCCLIEDLRLPACCCGFSCRHEYACECEFEYELKIKNGIPWGMGLGSSSALVVGVVTVVLCLAVEVPDDEWTDDDTGVVWS